MAKNKSNMIQLEAQRLPPRYLLCKRAIGTFTEGNPHDVRIQEMQGKIYKPGKDKEGKWLDQVGKEDHRLMVMSDSYPNFCYHVFKDVKEINEYFDEIPRPE